MPALVDAAPLETGGVLVANAGTIHVFRTAAELKQRGLLKRCATSVYVREALLRSIPAPFRASLSRRTVNRRCEELDGFVDTRPLPELLYLAAHRMHIGDPASWIAWRNEGFCRWLANRGLDAVEVVWGFDTSSCELFEAARRRGISCVLDMTIAHPLTGERILSDYIRKRPELASQLKVRPISKEQLARRNREVELADVVMAGSSFVRDSLLVLGLSPSKIQVNPYGVDLDEFAPPREPEEQRWGHRPARFLFVGWFSARKGIYDVLDAWAASGLAAEGCQLVLAGGTRSELTAWHGAFPDGVTPMGRVAHSDLPTVYSRADVFVFPSLFEGSAKVVLEAMATGLPVITTHTSCDEHCVVDGVNGFRIDVGDVEALASRMRELARNTAMRKAMSAAALEAVSHYSWSSYGERVADACHRLLRIRRSAGWASR